MDIDVVNNTRDLTLTPWHRELIGRNARRIEQLLEPFPPDAVHLRVIVDDDAGHANKTAVAVRLSLPGRLLTSRAAPFPEGVGEAFDELRRQLIEYEERLRGEPDYKRKRRAARQATP